MAKAGLSRERILKAAVDLVDRDGLSALSMRRVAEELDAAPMSLYRHVTNKADLLDGVYEAILSGMPLPGRQGDWKSDARALAGAFRAALLAHPNAVILFATRPAVTPAALSYLE